MLTDEQKIVAFDMFADALSDRHNKLMEDLAFDHPKWSDNECFDVAAEDLVGESENANSETFWFTDFVISALTGQKMEKDNPYWEILEKKGA